MDTMVCIKCEQEQPIGKFHVSKVVNGKTYRARKCNKCITPLKRAREKRIKSIFQARKEGLSCQKCGFADFRALQFHHRNKADKESNISDMFRRGMSVNNVELEIDKCDVLCANCHQILHWEERNRV